MQKKRKKTDRISFSSGQKYSYYHITEDNLLSYLKDLGQTQPLKRKEEEKLAEKIQKGDQKSLNELVRRNLKFVLLIARKYKNRNVALLDLVNEGNIGLIQAAKRFKPQKKVKFITYAIWWIRQAIQHALARERGIVRLPFKEALIFNRLCKKYRELLQKYKRELTLDEIAKELKVSPQKLTAILGACDHSLSLYSSIKENSVESLQGYKTNSLEEDVIRASLTQKIDTLLKGLSKKEEKILRMRFGFGCSPKSLQEVAREIGLTRERIRQIQNQATQKLRMKAKSEALADYLN